MHPKMSFANAFLATMHWLKSNKGVLFGLITFFLLASFSFFIGISDIIYRNGIFQCFRICFDYTLNLLPFPLLYLELAAFPLLLFYYGKQFKGLSGKLILFPINLFGWIVSIFFWTWGFNYSCTPLVGDQSSASLSDVQLFSFGMEILEELNHTSAEWAKLSAHDDAVEANIVLRLKNQLHAYDVCALGNPKYQQIGLEGTLRRLGIAGVYIPFAGQAHGDESFLPLTSRFICAHELSHAFGITSEAEADFFAYLTLTRPYQSEVDSGLWYAGKLELFRTIRYRLRMIDNDLRLKLDSNMREMVTENITKIKENALLYPEFFPGVQDSVNNQYLKVMGIKDGIRNYDYFVELAFAEAHRLP